MKCMERNKRDLWYAVYVGKEEILKDGKRTGQVTVKYSAPVKIKASVSPARGSASEELFGVNAVYDRTVIVEDANADITETSVIWVENTPDEPWDYVVEKVARSLNNAAIAIKRVSTQ